MLTHQPPELLRDGRMSPAVDIYRFENQKMQGLCRATPLSVCACMNGPDEAVDH